VTTAPHVEAINRIVTQRTLYAAAQKELGARTLLESKLREAFHGSDALCESDADGLARLAVAVFSEFLRNPPCFATCAVCGDTTIRDGDQVIRYDGGQGLCEHQENASNSPDRRMT
jgi:hypothetical protein